MYFQRAQDITDHKTLLQAFKIVEADENIEKIDITLKGEKVSKIMEAETSKKSEKIGQNLEIETSEKGQTLEIEKNETLEVETSEKSETLEDEKKENEGTIQKIRKIGTSETVRKVS